MVLVLEQRQEEGHELLDRVALAEHGGKAHDDRGKGGAYVVRGVDGQVPRARQKVLQSGGDRHPLAEVRHLERGSGAYLGLRVLQEFDQGGRHLALHHGLCLRVGDLAVALRYHAAHPPPLVLVQEPDDGQDQLVALLWGEDLAERHAVLHGDDANRILLVGCKLGKEGDDLPVEVAGRHHLAEPPKGLAGGLAHHRDVVPAQLRKHGAHLPLARRRHRRVDGGKEGRRRDVGRVVVSRSQALEEGHELLLRPRHRLDHLLHAFHRLVAHEGLLGCAEGLEGLQQDVRESLSPHVGNEAPELLRHRQQYLVLVLHLARHLVDVWGQFHAGPLRAQGCGDGAQPSDAFQAGLGVVIPQLIDENLDGRELVAIRHVHVRHRRPPLDVRTLLAQPNSSQVRRIRVQRRVCGGMKGAW
mmetsp:Transcript_37828/g.96704  ORF Transcript_37828/g.96704 Transcript_37828/m.96704 type:complete len:414 (+) Transcript_37828:686-1927(+)